MAQLETIVELQQAQIQMLKARLAAAENKTGCWAQKMIWDEGWECEVEKPIEHTQKKPQHLGLVLFRGGVVFLVNISDVWGHTGCTVVPLSGRCS